MSPEIIFNIHLILGYVAWLLCFRTYLLPRLKSMDRVEAHRAIATLHSFRFFGLVFILPGVIGNLPASFATFAAYWDLATGVLAILALLTIRIRPLFWLFVFAFNLVGTLDLVLDYYHAVRTGYSCTGGPVWRHICDPHHLCAPVDDHARHGLLLVAASPEKRSSSLRWRHGGIFRFEAKSDWQANRELTYYPLPCCFTPCSSPC